MLSAEAVPVRVLNLLVRYGPKKAVDGLTFEVGRGEIYGLLGPNGAGKTSTIKAMIGLVDMEGGSVSVYGRDVRNEAVEVKSLVGTVLESPVLFDSLTPNEFFEFVGSVRKLKDEKRVKVLVDALELGEYVDTPIAALSMGNKQKVAMITALMHEPKLLILDEPFNGLDVRSVAIFKDLILNQAEKGGAVLFSTHIMEVAERICTRVGIIDKGKMVAEGTVDQLKATIRGSTLEEVFLKATNLEQEISGIIKGLG
jgi:ABC-2 type transport system ATP-binding protein